MSAEDKALAEKVLMDALPGLMDSAGGDALPMSVEVVQAVDTLNCPPASLSVLRIAVVGDDVVTVPGRWELIHVGRSLIAQEFVDGVPTTRGVIFTHVPQSV